MKVRPILLVNLLVVVLMAGFALWAAGKAPAGMQLPTHWNMEGEVDRTAIEASEGVGHTGQASVQRRFVQGSLQGIERLLGCDDRPCPAGGGVVLTPRLRADQRAHFVQALAGGIDTRIVHSGTGIGHQR